MIELLEAAEFWHWWAFGTALIVLELIMPSTVLLWPGLAAAVVGLILLIFDDLGWRYQLLLFAVLSVLCLVVGRRYLLARHKPEDETTLNRRAEQHTGREFVLDEAIHNGRGQIKLDGFIWKLKGPDMAAGSRVKVSGTDGVVLVVEAV